MNTGLVFSDIKQIHYAVNVTVGKRFKVVQIWKLAKT